MARKMLSIVDTHTHLDMAAFSEDRADVITRARECGVATIVSVGTDLSSSREAIGLAESHAEVWAAVLGMENPLYGQQWFDDQEESE